LRRSIVIATLLACGLISRARSGEVLDRVRHDRIVRCASEAGADEMVGLCRAVATRVIGGGGQVMFVDGPPTIDTDLAMVASGDVPDRFVTGPVLFNAPLAVLVPEASPVRALRDLGGQTVCLMIGSPAQDALEQLVRRLSLNVTRFGFEEDVEMADAYAVGRCGAMVGYAAWLAGSRGPAGINGLRSRLLDEPFGVVPLFVATDRADPEWAGIVVGIARERTSVAHTRGFDESRDPMRPAPR
jgi:hypothetical protein